MEKIVKKLLSFVLPLVMAVCFSCVIDDNSSESESFPTVLETHALVTVVPHNHAAKIICDEAEPGESFLYQWYESADRTILPETDTLITGATKQEFTTPVFSEKGIRYYYRIATSAVTGEAKTSALYTVGCTGLPLVLIDTVDGEEPYGEGINYTIGGGNYGYGLINTTKVPARMKIVKDEKIVYDSGEYAEKTSGLTIKLRGNTSAGMSETGPLDTKHPYKLKLQKKVDLLADLVGRNDKKYKDKNWILLKDGTSLKTFVGLAVADFAGTPWTPEFAFVNVMLNGNYRGIYLLIESISRSEARIAVADDGYIIERDAYWWNEDVKFITDLNQKYTFKYPDDDDLTVKQLQYISDYMKQVETHVQDGTYEDYIDTESFARWILVHDILGIGDGAGSNMYLAKYDSTSAENPYADGTWSKLAMSTPWDFDSNYMNKNAWATRHGYGTGTYLFLFPYLFTSENHAFLDSYKAQWDSLSSAICTDVSEKLADVQTNSGDDINLSRKLDAVRWETTFSTVEKDIETAEDWFSSRVPWLNTAIGGL